MPPPVPQRWTLEFEKVMCFLYLIHMPPASNFVNIVLGLESLSDLKNLRSLDTSLQESRTWSLISFLFRNRLFLNVCRFLLFKSAHTFCITLKSVDLGGHIVMFDLTPASKPVLNVLRYCTPTSCPPGM